MTDTRVLKDQAGQIDNQLQHAIREANQNGELALWHIEKATRVLDELRREIWLMSHRSGERG